MTRTLRAFVWARWRILNNSIRGAGRRDRFERFARIGALLSPVLYALMLVPACIALSVGAFAGGWFMARSNAASTVVIDVGRVMLALVTLGVLLTPIFRSMQGTQLDIGRLLLLPVPRRLLHLADAVSALADPLVAVVIPGLWLLPAGLILGGAPTAGLLALVAGVLFAATMGAAGCFCTNGVMLIFRDRRRAEWLTLVVLVGATLIAFAPALFEGGLEINFEKNDPSGGDDGVAASPDFATMFRWAAPLPSELWGGAISAGATGRISAALFRLAALAAIGGLFYSLSAVFHRRLLENPERISGQRGGEPTRVRSWTFPGVSRTASAVAVAQVRTTLRTVRGKMAVYFVVVAVVMMATVLSPRLATETSVVAGLDLGPLGLLVGGLLTLLSLHPILLNQFAVDGPGLTLQFLTPISTRDLVHGKALGCTLLACISLALCLVGSMIVLPGGHPLAWVAMLLVCGSALVPLVPACAVISALFPKPADLSRIGRAGNPHQLAGLIGVVLTAAALLPPLALYAVGMVMLGSPSRTMLMLGLWSAAALAMAMALGRLARSVVARRRENLFLVTSES